MRGVSIFHDFHRMTTPPFRKPMFKCAIVQPIVDDTERNTYANLETIRKWSMRIEKPRTKAFDFLIPSFIIIEELARETIHTTLRVST